ncbi:hypothetical protein BaRGS_00036535, partial [Batillaria attramentaria]
CAADTSPHVLENCIQWPRAVTQYDKVACTCYSDNAGTLHWKDPQGRELLNTTDVALDLPAGLIKQKDSGRPFSCVMTLQGTPYLNTSYFPLVAYGPSDASITSVYKYAPNDGSSMTLTCTARNVNPMPAFKWQGQMKDAVYLPGSYLSNGTFSQSVIFDPSASQDGDIIKCLVRNSAIPSPTSQAEYILRFQPPGDATVPESRYIGVVVSLCLVLVTSLSLLVLQWLFYRRRLRTALEGRSSEMSSEENLVNTARESRKKHTGGV